jgi:uncharacterized membrane protein YfcA
VSNSYGALDLRLTVAGLVVGIIAGISGIGGSALLAPILILLFGVKASIAVGTDLVYSVPMKALAAFAHFRQGTVDGRVVRSLALGGIPGALVGLLGFALARARFGEAALEGILRHAIGIAILCAVVMLIATLFLKRPQPSSVDYRPGTTIAIGAGVGFLVALTSIGSGSITLPLLLLVLPAISLRKLIGAEIVFAALMVPVAALGHVAFANVDWMKALSLVAGAVPGAYLGARLSTRLGEVVLRPAVIGVLAVAGYKLL